MFVEKSLHKSGIPESGGNRHPEGVLCCWRICSDTMEGTGSGQTYREAKGEGRPHGGASENKLRHFLFH